MKQYPVPIIVSPETSAIFYPDQLIEIKWIVPDSTEAVEMQLLSTIDEDFFANGTILFDTLSWSDTYENQTSYSFRTDSNLSEVTYFGFRLRYKAFDGFSPWTEIHYFKILPYSYLDVKYITIVANFNFITKEDNNYYSGLINSNNLIDLNTVLLDNGYNTANLEFIKPSKGTVIDNSDFSFHIERLVFGFNEVQDIDFPFDVWGDVYGIDVNSDVTFGPFGGIYRNIYEEIGNKKINMKAAYFLSQFHEEPDMIGIQHDVVISVLLKCYFSK